MVYQIENQSKAQCVSKEEATNANDGKMIMPYFAIVEIRDWPKR